jgi:hypothetical protein
MMHALADLAGICLLAYLGLGRLAAAVVRWRARRRVDHQIAARWGTSRRTKR